MMAPSSCSEGWERSASWTCGSNVPSVSISTRPLGASASSSSRWTSRTPSSSLASSCSSAASKRALEVVEHGQELLDEPLVGARDQALLVARDPLAVVLEVGGDALEVVEILVALLLEPRRALLEVASSMLRAPPSSAFFSVIA